MRLTQKEFAKAYSEAFSALPVCYQNDSVLVFDVKTYGFESTSERSNVAWMICYPKADQESALGEWRASFTKGEWMVTTPRKLDHREYVRKCEIDTEKAESDTPYHDPCFSYSMDGDK